MKRFIAHRGITDGNYSDRENKVDTIIQALRYGYEVEVDVRLFNGEIYLGHDEPQEKLSKLWNRMRTGIDWIPYGGLWYHCKDSGSLDYFKKLNMYNYFWHDQDNFTITSKGHIWTADLCGCYPVDTFVVVKNKDDLVSQSETNCAGICSPFIGELVNVP